MTDQHKISEYIDGINFKKSLGMGFRPDDVYEAICNLTSMYNEVLSEAYRDNDKLRNQLFELRKKLNSQGTVPAAPAAAPVAAAGEPAFGTKEYFAREFAMRYGVGEETAPEEIVPEPSCEERENEPERAMSDEPQDFLNAGQFSSFWENEPGKKSKKKQQKQDKPAEEKTSRVQHLRRAELLEILIEQSRENERLKEELEQMTEKNAELTDKLADRTIKIEKAGTLAEATFLINGVVESSQAAAQQYLENLKSLYDREEVNCVRKEEEAKRIIDDAEAKSEQILHAAEDKCAVISDMTRKRCESMKLEMERSCAEMEDASRRRCEELEAATRAVCEAKEKQTEERCAAIEKNARRDTEKYWTELTERLEDFYSAHQGLRELLSATGHVPKI